MITIFVLVGLIGINLCMWRLLGGVVNLAAAGIIFAILIWVINRLAKEDRW